MKKLAIRTAGVATLSALALGVSGAAHADVTTHISGNLQYTDMEYYCDNGTPNFWFSYRTLNITEEKLTFSATGYRDFIDYDVEPYTEGGELTSMDPAAGKAITLTAKGSTSGSSFTLNATVPTTCAGLPDAPPAFSWDDEGRPTATTTSSSSTTSSPTSTSTSASPTSTSTSATPTSTSTSTNTDNPTTTSTASGPVVVTDGPQQAGSNNAALLAGGAGAATLLAAGGVAVRRRLQD